MRVISARLDLLHSVLRVPHSIYLPVRLLHLSFRDFLLDPEKKDSNRFWIEEKKTHARLAERCIFTLSRLKQDICGVKEPGAHLSTISAEAVDQNLPSEMKYACLYWVTHLQKSGRLIQDGDPTHEFLCKHFLHWLEALSLLTRLSEGLRCIKILLTLVNVCLFFLAGTRD